MSTDGLRLVGGHRPAGGGLRHAGGLLRPAGGGLRHAGGLLRPAGGGFHHAVAQRSSPSL